MRPAAMIRPELPYLDTFASAAELSNFSAAGRLHGITQAAVSQRIQALERELRTSLFRRRGGRVELTDAGRTLYDYAQRIGGLHQQAREAIGGQKQAVVRELALAASTVPGEYLLPTLLANFRRQQPNIRVRVTIAASDSVIQLVEQGKVHIGISGRKPVRPCLESEAFARDELVLAVPPRHAWAKRLRVPWTMVASKPLIVREAGSGSRYFLEQAHAQSAAAAHDLAVAWELGSNEAIKQAVKRGLGLAILSSHAVQKERQSGSLRVLHIDGLNLKRTIYLVRDRRRVLSAAERLFLDFIHAKSAPPAK